jgi:bifunctional DNase/RNase
MRSTPRIPQRTTAHNATNVHRQRRADRLTALALLGILGYLCGSLSATAQSRQRSKTKDQGDEVVQVEVDDMVVTPRGMAMTLTSDETQQELHLMVGSVEGQSILRALRHASIPRPQTHDLMKTLLEEDGWQVTRVIIRDLVDDTYYADIVMERPGEFGIEGNVEERTIDARPSDAMALGLRFDAKIYVRQKVFDKEREHLQEAPSDKKEEDAPDTLTI